MLITTPANMISKFLFPVISKKYSAGLQRIRNTYSSLKLGREQGFHTWGSDKHLKEDSMTSKIRLFALGAMLGLGSVTFSGPGASAGALPLSPITPGQVNAVGDGVLQVNHRNDHRMRSSWEGRRDGRRCSRREGNCRHFHDGYYYETPWWTLPLIVGGIATHNDGYGRMSCGEARARVRNSGFRNVATIECNGRTYTFEASRRGRDVTVFVNSLTGAVWRD